MDARYLILLRPIRYMPSFIFPLLLPINGYKKARPVGSIPKRTNELVA